MNIGDRFGHWTVLEHEDIYNPSILCQCDCGSSQRQVRRQQLRNGESLSCGCRRYEKITKHGNWNHPLYKVWRMMITRCTKPANKDHKYYYDKGITVCERWQSLDNFIEDMYHSYTNGLTLERVNSSKGYAPDNCRWATRKEQSRNKSDNLLITFNGETHCVAEWAEITGISDTTIRLRIKRRGWTPEKALTTPARVINQPAERYLKKNPN